MSRLGRLPLAVVGVAAIAVPLVVARRRAQRRLAESEQELRMRGYLGRGTVLAATPTGRTNEDGRHEFELQLDVFVPRYRRFVASTVAWVSPDRIARLELGKAIPVAADPDEPGRVVVAFDADDPVSIAGLGPFAGGPGGPRRSDPPVSPAEREPEAVR